MARAQVEHRGWRWGFNVSQLLRFAVQFRSELESPHKLSLPREQGRSGRIGIYPAEAARGLAGDRIRQLRRRECCPRPPVGGVGNARTVKHVRKFRPYVQAHPFSEPEGAAERNVFGWAALIAVVAVIRKIVNDLNTCGPFSQPAPMPSTSPPRRTNARRVAQSARAAVAVSVSPTIRTQSGQPNCASPSSRLQSWPASVSDSS